MRITNDGNVGIGTTTPPEKLTVAGNISASGNITASALTLKSAAGTGHLLHLHNTTNGSGASIHFSDQTNHDQTGTIDFLHQDGFSQGGNSTFVISSTENDMVLNVGGRILATPHSSNTEVDYGFVDDIDTGMMRPSANTLRLVTSGSAIADMSVNSFTLTGNLTASNNISASGAGSFGSLTVNGVALGDSTVLSAGTATVATNVTAVATTDDAEFFVGLLDGASGTQAVETNTRFKFNPNDGKLTFTGNISASGHISASEFVGGQGNSDVDTGTETVATATNATAAFFDYVAKNGTNLRAGTVTSVTDGTNVEFNEVSTVDLGDTTDVKFSVVLSSGNLLLKATVLSDNWNIRALVRKI